MEHCMFQDLVMLSCSCQLDWSANIDAVVKKANQRLFFLRKLRQFHVDPQILRLFFQSSIQSILSYNQLCYHSSAKKMDMDKLEKIVSRASTIIGEDLQSMDSLFSGVALQKLQRIRLDNQHPLHQTVAACEPRRETSRRLRSLPARTNRMLDSFLPTAIRLFNQQLGVL